MKESQIAAFKFSHRLTVKDLQHRSIGLRPNRLRVGCDPNVDQGSDGKETFANQLIMVLCKLFASAFKIAGRPLLPFLDFDPLSCWQLLLSWLPGLTGSLGCALEAIIYALLKQLF